MNEAFDDALVTGWEPLEGGIKLPDPDDRHVAAAALRGGADVIVTQNLRDFPRDKLEPLGLEAVGLDDFLLDQMDFSPGLCVKVVKNQAGATRNPAVSIHDMVSRLERSGAPRFASKVAELID